MRAWTRRPRPSSSGTGRRGSVSRGASLADEVFLGKYSPV